MVDLREYFNAVGERLAGLTPATTGYYGAIGRPLPGSTGTPTDPQPKGPKDPRVRPYFVLYPGAGADGPDQALCQTTPSGTIVTTRITAAAGDLEDLLALITRINDRVLGWVPTLATVAFPGPIVRFPGYDAPVLNDPSVTPPRQYALLQYQATI